MARIEFQNTGAPHCHMLIWIKDFEMTLQNIDNIRSACCTNSKDGTCQCNFPKTFNLIYRIQKKLSSRGVLTRHVNNPKPFNLIYRIQKKLSSRGVLTRPVNNEYGDNEAPSKPKALDEEMISKLYVLRQLLTRSMFGNNSIGIFIAKCFGTNEKYLIT